jgi:hypothetical protein
LDAAIRVRQPDGSEYACSEPFMRWCARKDVVAVLVPGSNLGRKRFDAIIALAEQEMKHVR